MKKGVACDRYIFVPVIGHDKTGVSCDRYVFVPVMGHVGSSGPHKLARRCTAFGCSIYIYIYIYIYVWNVFYSTIFGFSLFLELWSLGAIF